MQVFAINIVLAFNFLVGSTLQLSTSPRLSYGRDSVPGSIKDFGAKLVKRAPAFATPRFVFIPLIGPITFNNVFDWGIANQDASDVGPNTKQIAVQALASVLQEYDLQHPETTTQLALEMREVFLQESGQLPSDEEADIPKAKQDIAQFFEKHPELQAEVENKFADLYENSLTQGTSSDHDESSKVPNDWAHVNLNDG